MLANTDPEKEAMKRQLEDEHPEWRESRPMPKPIENVLRSMIETTPIEEYCHDPWWIVRVKTNSYKTAENSLKREGFECYSPTFKVLTSVPLRFVPPKKRHQATLYRREIRRRQFDGYIFVRRMFGNFDLNRMFDLDGCGAIIRAAGTIGLVLDYDIELMRLVEMDGTMDQVTVETFRGYKVTRLNDDQQWEGSSKIIGRLDDSQRTVLFVERMGRIAQLISRADPE